MFVTCNKTCRQPHGQAHPPIELNLQTQRSHAIGVAYPLVVWCYEHRAISIARSFQIRLGYLESLHHPGQRDIHAGIVFRLQSLKGAPVHSLGFPSVAVENARLPSKPPPDRVGSPYGPVIIRFPLALIGQLVTVPTGED